MNKDELQNIIEELRRNGSIRYDSDLAKMLEIPKSNLSLMAKGERGVPKRVAEKLIEIRNKFLNDNYVINNGTDRVNAVKEPNQTYQTKRKDTLRLIPYYDIDFYGGFEKVFADQKINPAFFINNPIFYKAEFAVNLSGRSMSGVIPTNAVIGLREIRDWQTYFPSGEIYAIVTKNDMRTVKKIKWDKSRENLILIPEPAQQFKDDYSIEPLSKNFVTNFYEVVAWEQFGKLAM